MMKFIKERASTLAILSLLASPVLAFDEHEFNIKFGGWSKHLDEKNMAGREWNESHTGLGLKYTHDLGFDLDVIAEVWFMKDSYFEKTGYAGVGASYTVPLDSESISIDINILGSLLSRKMHSYDRLNDVLTSESKISFVPSYYITLNIFDTLDVDFTYVPSGIGGVNSNVYFMRFGYKF
jgi:hypothetical protein